MATVAGRKGSKCRDWSDQVYVCGLSVMLKLDSGPRQSFIFELESLSLLSSRSTREVIKRAQATRMIESRITAGHSAPKS